MTVDLTPEEIKLIALGFYAAQGEGYLNDVLFPVCDYDKEETKNLKALLDKLGIGYDEKGHVYLRS